MRILIKLRSLKEYVYDLKYYNKLQGFIYNLLRDSEFSYLHDTIKYKFFCFSNVYPIINNEEGSIKNLIISSPDEKLLALIESKLNRIKENKEKINIGELLFEILDIKKFKVKLGKNFSLISATPITLRIPNYNYALYGITDSRKYIYWKPEYSFEAFLKQLSENLFKKYNEFYNLNIKPFTLFEQFIFKKSTCNHLIINGFERKVIGSNWMFIFNYLNEEQKKVLEFGIDCGFGERNSFGFGFVNLINEN